MLKKLLSNQSVLYAFLLLGAVNVVLYLCTKRYECLGTLLLTAYLSNFVTKNRTVDIIVALIVANVVLGCGVYKEGMTEKEGGGCVYSKWGCYKKGEVPEA